MSLNTPQEVQNQLQDWYSDLWKNLSVPIYKELDCEVLCSGIQSAYLNGVIKASISNEDHVDRIVKNVEQTFRQKQLPYSWWVEAKDKPQYLEKVIIDLGMKLQHQFPGFSLELKKLRFKEKPPDVELSRVRDIRDLQVWSQIIGNVFDFPETKKYANLYVENGLKGSFLHLIGKYKGIPVATASALYDKAVMSIYNVATLPSARNFGVSSYLIHELLRLGKERKVQFCVLLTSMQSSPIYLNLGFKECLTYNFYVK